MNYYIECTTPLNWMLAGEKLDAAGLERANTVLCPIKEDTFEKFKLIIVDLDVKGWMYYMHFIDLKKYGYTPIPIDQFLSPDFDPLHPNNVTDLNFENGNG